MQIRWRKNPRTEAGWFKWTAISLLSALGIFIVSFPIAFLLFLSHLRGVSPDDPQNILGAITASVVTGIVLGGIGFFGCMALFLLFSFRGKPATR